MSKKEAITTTATVVGTLVAIASMIFAILTHVAPTDGGSSPHEPRKASEPAGKSEDTNESTDPRAWTGDLMSQTVRNYLFEFDQCELQGSELVCTFFVTNNAEDRYLRISHSRLITDSGVEHRAREIELGSSRLQGSVISMRVDMVSGIRIRGKLYFPSLSPTPEKIALVEIKCRGRNDSFSAQFRDVPL